MQINIQPIIGIRPAIINILNLHFDETSGYPAEEVFEINPNELLETYSKFFKVKIDCDIIGIGGIKFHDGFGELSKFYVVKEYRGQKIADAILDQVIECAKSRRIKDIRLETGTNQKAAIKFFKKQGFVECEPFAPYINYSPFAIDHSIFMRKLYK